MALRHGLLAADEVVDFIKTRPVELHLILTGRDCPDPVLAVADTVTRMEAVKHHLAAGIKSQPGIEY